MRVGFTLVVASAFICGGIVGIRWAGVDSPSVVPNSALGLPSVSSPSASEGVNQPEAPSVTRPPAPAGPVPGDVALSGGAAADATASPSILPAVSGPDVAGLMSDTQSASIIHQIEQAALAYDETVGPSIARHLLHADAEIRAAARDALLRAGHASGARYLRAAAEKIQDPREAVALLDAADFLELPPTPLPTRPNRSRGPAGETPRAAENGIRPGL